MDGQLTSRPGPEVLAFIKAADPARSGAELAEAIAADFGVSLVAYKRRIGRYLLWRAGPAAGADARYMAIAADDPGERWTFRLFADGSGEGTAPGGSHTRFRTWKEDLRDASVARSPAPPDRAPRPNRG